MANEDPIVWVLRESDVQDVAGMRINRELTSSEMLTAKACIEHGLATWDEVVEAAVDEAVGR